MPCTECKDGKYKWGETGDCEYNTLQECEDANHSYEEMKTSLNLQLVQRLGISPQLRKVIELLQLSNIELLAEIQKNFETNPMLPPIYVLEKNRNLSLFPASKGL